MENKIILILIFCISTCGGYLTRFSIKKVECGSDKEYIINPVCRLRSLSRNVQTTTSSIEVIKPIKNVWVRVIHTKKTYTNHYMPGLFDLSVNYCDLANETTTAAKFMWNTIKTLSAEFYDQIKTNLKYCPLMGYILITNITMKLETTNQMLTPPGEYRMEFRLLDANNRTLFFMKDYQLHQDKNRQS